MKELNSPSLFGQLKISRKAKKLEIQRARERIFNHSPVRVIPIFDEADCVEKGSPMNLERKIDIEPSLPREGERKKNRSRRLRRLLSAGKLK